MMISRNNREPHRTVPSATYKEAELLRQKIVIEDEVKANPLSQLTKQFYAQWAKNFVRQEPEIPP